MADFTATMSMLNRVMECRGEDILDLGGMKVECELTGGLSIIDSENSYSMARVPADVFEKLSRAIESYNNISSDGGLQ